MLKVWARRIFRGKFEAAARDYKTVGERLEPVW